jgi:hypothetical protein
MHETLTSEIPICSLWRVLLSTKCRLVHLPTAKTVYWSAMLHGVTPHKTGTSQSVQYENLKFHTKVVVAIQMFRNRTSEMLQYVFICHSTSFTKMKVGEHSWTVLKFGASKQNCDVLSQIIKISQYSLHTECTGCGKLTSFLQVQWLCAER